LSPEIFLTKNVGASPALDIWALGCILYALLVGELPFKGNTEKEIIQQILNKEIDFPKRIKISPEAKDLIQLILNKNPEKRIKIS
jgi:serine/threonine protein kinase